MNDHGNISHFDANCDNISFVPQYQVQDINKKIIDIKNDWVVRTYLQ